MSENLIFRDISSFGYSIKDFCRVLGVSPPTVNGYWHNGWQVPEEKMIILKELLLRLLRERYCR